MLGLVHSWGSSRAPWGAQLQAGSEGCRSWGRAGGGRGREEGPAFASRKMVAA